MRSRAGACRARIPSHGSSAGPQYQPFDHTHPGLGALQGTLQLSFAAATQPALRIRFRGSHHHLHPPVGLREAGEREVFRQSLHIGDHIRLPQADGLGLLRFEARPPLQLQLSTQLLLHHRPQQLHIHAHHIGTKPWTQLLLLKRRRLPPRIPPHPGLCRTWQEQQHGQEQRQQRQWPAAWHGCGGCQETGDDPPRSCRPRNAVSRAAGLWGSTIKTLPPGAWAIASPMAIQ